MKSFQNIIVLLPHDHIDMAENSVRHAVQLASSNGGNIHLRCSIEKGDAPLKRFDDILPMDELIDAMTTRLNNKLQILCEALTADGVNATYQTSLDRASIEAMKAAIALDADIIIKHAELENGAISTDRSATVAQECLPCVDDPQH